MRPAIIVGRRPDGGWRDRLWAYACSRWTEQLGWPIYEGLHLADERPEFCLAAASNRAASAAAAAGADVFVYVGADWIAYAGWQVEQAAKRALAEGQLVFAHDRTIVFTEDFTRHLIESPAGAEVNPPAMPVTGPQDVGYGVVHPNTFSGVLAVPRRLWVAVGGFDERFVGWGWDDLAFWSACTAVGGGFERIEGAAIAHLWHPTNWDERENAPTHGPNQVLGERYLEAKWNEAGMRAILSEPGGPLAR